MAEEVVKETHGYQYGSGYGVDAVLNISIDNENHPFCNHGPTMLFERFFKGKESRRFFACSACRDRKGCPFFQWEDEKLTPGKKLIQQEIKKNIFRRKKNITQLREGDIWCFDCGCGHTSQNTDDHESHATKVLTKNDILLPTQFLNPSDSKKYKAQYFFTDETCEFFLTTIKRLQCRNILCIGTPRLFELVRGTAGVSTILLDIDTRFENFYSSEEFLPYNIYNHFFFDKGERKKILKSFISKCSPEETLIFLDPPFGGLLNVLEKTLSKIWSLFGVESVPTIMIFPYFLEKHVSLNLPSLLMHDYKVAYSNHPSYHNSGKQPRGSPVRIFTNIPGDKLSLPKEEYRFCKLCQRYVYKANRHCKECNACTSKDGRTYIHCSLCKKCVKPGSSHCVTCNSCKPALHVCGSKNNLGCHICGDFDHKRMDCPQRVQKALSSDAGKKRKRKFKKKNNLNKMKKIAV